MTTAQGSTSPEPSSNGRDRRGRILRSVTTIGAATAFAQLLVAGSAPVIARLYDPAAVGTYTIVAAVAAILGSVAAWRWELAIPLSDNQEGVRSVVRIAMCSIAISTAFSSFLIFFAGDRIAKLIDFPDESYLLLLIPVIACAQATQLVLTQVAIRNNRFRAIASRNILRSFTMVTTQIAVGAVRSGPGGLTAGLAIGHLFATLSLAKGSGLRGPKAPVRAIASRFRRFPLVLGPAALINVLGLHLPFLIFAVQFGPAAAGHLGMAQTALAVPVALVGQAIGQVYLSEFATGRRMGPEYYKKSFMHATVTLAAVAVPLVITLLAIGPWLFTRVLGEDWALSGDLARALALATGLQLITVPLSQVLVISERQIAQLVWDISRLFLVAGAVMIAILTGFDAQEVVFAWGIAASGAYGSLWVLAYRTVNPPSRQREGSSCIL